MKKALKATLAVLLTILLVAAPMSGATSVLSQYLQTASALGSADYSTLTSRLQTYVNAYNTWAGSQTELNSLKVENARFHASEALYDVVYSLVAVPTRFVKVDAYITMRTEITWWAHISERGEDTGYMAQVRSAVHSGTGYNSGVASDLINSLIPDYGDEYRTASASEDYIVLSTGNRQVTIGNYSWWDRGDIINLSGYECYSVGPNGDSDTELYRTDKYVTVSRSVKAAMIENGTSSSAVNSIPTNPVTSFQIRWNIGVCSAYDDDQAATQGAEILCEYHYFDAKPEKVNTSTTSTAPQRQYIIDFVNRFGASSSDHASATLNGEINNPNAWYDKDASTLATNISTNNNVYNNFASIYGSYGNVFVDASWYSSGVPSVKTEAEAAKLYRDVINEGKLIQLNSLYSNPGAEVNASNKEAQGKVAGGPTGNYKTAVDDFNDLYSKFGSYSPNANGTKEQRALYYLNNTATGNNRLKSWTDYKNNYINPLRVNISLYEIREAKVNFYNVMTAVAPYELTPEQAEQYDRYYTSALTDDQLAAYAGTAAGVYDALLGVTARNTNGYTRPTSDNGLGYSANAWPAQTVYQVLAESGVTVNGVTTPALPLSQMTGFVDKLYDEMDKRDTRTDAEKEADGYGAYRVSELIRWYVYTSSLDYSSLPSVYAARPANDASVKALIAESASMLSRYDNLRNAMINKAGYTAAQADSALVLTDGTNLRTAISNEANNEIDYLCSIIKTQVDDAYKLWYTGTGGTGKTVNAYNYRQIINAVENLDDDLVAYLNYGNSYQSNRSGAYVNRAGSGAYDNLSIIAEYNKLKVDLYNQARAWADKWANWQVIEQETNRSDSGNFAVRRGDGDNTALSPEYDLARITGEDYTVSNTVVSSTLQQIDNMLSGTDIAKILSFNIKKGTDAAGNDIYYTKADGSPIDNLEDLIDAIIRDKLYNDKIINMLIQNLFPLLSSMLGPMLYKLLYIEGPDVSPFNKTPITQASISGGTGGTFHADYLVEDIKLWVNGAGSSHTFAQIFHDAGIDLYPAYLKDHINSSYFPQVYNAINSAASWNPGNSTNAHTDTFANSVGDWAQPNYVTGDIIAYNPYVFYTSAGVDANGDEYDVGDCSLVWNINGSADRFELALSNIFDAITPLLQVALGGKTDYAKRANDLATVQAFVRGSAGISDWTGDIDGTVKIDWIDIYLGVTSTRTSGGTFYGFRDLIAPVFEALGVTDFEYGDNVALSDPGPNATAAQYVSSIMTPLKALVRQITHQPLQKALSILPNACMAIDRGLIEPLVQGIQLNLHIWVADYASPDVNVTGDWPDWDWLQSTIGAGINYLVESIANAFSSKITSALDFSFSIDFDDFINLQKLLEVDDITSLNAILKRFLGEADDERIQNILAHMIPIDTGTLAQSGTKTETSSIRTYNASNTLGAGRRYTITADKNDVFWLILKYVIRTLKDPGMLETLLGFMSVESGSKYFDILKTAIVSIPDVDQACAAIIELFSPQYYKYTDYGVWRNSTADGAAYTNVNGVYLNYGAHNLWTKDKAQYIYNNVDDIVSSIMGKDIRVNEYIKQELLTEVMSKDTVASIMQLMGSLADVIDDQNVLKLLVGDELGLDTSTWQTYKPYKNANGDTYEYPEGDFYAGETASDVIEWKRVFYYKESGIKDERGYDNADENWKNLPGSINDSFGPGLLKFYDGDETAFRNSVVKLFSTFSGLLGYIIGGENLSVLKGKNGQYCLTMLGYDGYTYGLLPLLDALGLNDAPKTLTAFRAMCGTTASTLPGYGSSTQYDYFNGLVTLLFGGTAANGTVYKGIVERILDSETPLKDVLNILSKVLYLLDTDALYPMIANSAKSLLVLVDTVRPVIDLWKDLLVPVLKIQLVGEEPGEEPKLGRLTDKAETGIDRVLAGSLRLPFDNVELPGLKELLKTRNVLFLAELLTGMDGLDTIFYNALTMFFPGTVSSYEVQGANDYYGSRATRPAALSQKMFWHANVIDQGEESTTTVFAWDVITWLVEVLVELGFYEDQSINVDNLNALSTILVGLLPSTKELVGAEKQAKIDQLYQNLKKIKDILFNGVSATEADINWTYFYRAVSSTVDPAQTGLSDESPMALKPEQQAALSEVWNDALNTNRLNPLAQILIANNIREARTMYKFENLYLTNWTAEAAEYMTGNFNVMVDQILAAVGLEIEVDGEKIKLDSVDAIARNISSIVYTREMLSKIAGGLSKLLDGSESLNAKLIEAVGRILDMGQLTELYYDEDHNPVPVSAFYKFTPEAAGKTFYVYNELTHDYGGSGITVGEYVLDEDGEDLYSSLFADQSNVDYYFEDGNTDGFVNALVNMFAPVNTILRFALLGQNITAFYGSLEGKLAKDQGGNYADGGDLFYLSGFDAYNWAIIPIFEALGIDTSEMATKDELIEISDGDNEAILRAVIAPIIHQIDVLANDPAQALDIIPNLIHFVGADGLTTCVYNILGGIYNVIDIINDLVPVFKDDYEAIDLSNVGDILNLYNLNWADRDDHGTVAPGFLTLIEYLLNTREEKVMVDVLDSEGNKIPVYVYNDQGERVQKVDEEGNPVWVQEEDSERVPYEITIDLSILREVLTNFYVGEITAFKSKNGKYGTKMVLESYDSEGVLDPGRTASNRAEMITVLASTLLGVFSQPGNIEAIARIAGNMKEEDDPDKIAKQQQIYQLLQTVYDVITNNDEIVFKQGNWFYMYENSNELDPLTVIKDGTDSTEFVATLNYLKYANQWNKEAALSLTDSLVPIADNLLSDVEVLGTKYPTTTELINGVLNSKVYSNELLYKIASLVDTYLPQNIKNLSSLIGYGEIDGGLLEKLLGVNLSAYYDKAERYNPENAGTDNYIEVNDAESFKTALIDLLSPLDGALRWILLDEPIKLFNDDFYLDGGSMATDDISTDAYITIKGGNAYVKALVPLYVALGIDPDDITPAREIKENAKNNDNKALATAIVTPLLDKIAELTQDTVDDYGNVTEYAAEKVLNLLPNLLYFINAGGLNLVVKNLLAFITNDAGTGIIDRALPLLIKVNEETGEEESLVPQLLKKNEEGVWIINLKSLVSEVEEKYNITVLDDNGDLVLNIGTVLQILEAETGIRVNHNLSNYLSRFFMGKLTRYSFGTGDGLDPNTFIGYYTVYDQGNRQQRADFITLLLTLALEIVTDEDNAAAIATLINKYANLDRTITEDMIISVFAVLKENLMYFREFNWLYMFDGEDGESVEARLERHEGILDAENNRVILPDKLLDYLAYNNDWSQEAAEYIIAHIDDVVEGLVLPMMGVDESLGEWVRGMLTDAIAKLVGQADNEEYEIFSTETIYFVEKTIADLVQNLFDALHETTEHHPLIDVIESVLGLRDLTMWSRDLAADAYPHTIESGNKNQFLVEMTKILAPAGKLLGFLLTGESLSFFYSYYDGEDYEAQENDLIKIKGGEGYKYGLMPLLNALGCDVVDSSRVNTDNIVNVLLTTIVNRIDEVLNDPFNEVIDLLPNLIYFINANGLSVSVENLLMSVNGILNAYGTIVGEDASTPIKFIDSLIRKIDNTTVQAILNDFDIENITFEQIINAAENYLNNELLPSKGSDAQVKIYDVIGDYLTHFYIGDLTYIGGAETGYQAFKMDFRTDTEENYDADRADFVTILLSMVLDVLEYEEDGKLVNAEAIDALIGKDGLAQAIVNLIKGKYKPADLLGYEWLYMIDDDNANVSVEDMMTPGKVITKKDYQNETAEYLKYQNRWTETAADNLAENIDEIINDVLAAITSKSDAPVTSLKALLMSKIDFNEIYSTDNIAKLAGLVQGLVDSLDNPTIKVILEDGTAFEFVRFLTGLDLEFYTKIVRKDADGNWQLTDYAKANGLKLAKEGDQTAFINSLATLLAPVSPLLEWLLLGKSFTFFNDNNDVATPGQPDAADFISIKGGDGWTTAIVPLLEHLGCIEVTGENKDHVETLIKSASQINAELESQRANDDITDPTTYADNTALIKAVLEPIAGVLNRILDSTDPVETLLDMIPNILYFINANGLTVAVNNLLAPVGNMVAAVSDIMVSLDKDAIDLTATLNELLANVKIDGKDLGLDISDLGMRAVLRGLDNILDTGLDADFGEFISGFYLGQLVSYESATEDVGYALTYTDETTRKDLITTLVSLVFGIAKDTKNKALIKRLLAKLDENADDAKLEEMYAAFIDVLNLKSTYLREFNWYFTEKADTGEKLSPFIQSETTNTTVLWVNHGYGAHWTQEKAEYVAANLESCLDNTIKLLGIKRSLLGIDAKTITGEDTFQNLGDLLVSAVGGSVYTEANAEKILSVFKDKLVGAIDSNLPRETAEIVKTEVKEILGVDLHAWDGMSEFGIRKGDRAAFTRALYQILKPAEPLLAFLLIKDPAYDLSFFYSRVDGDPNVIKDALVLLSEDGYAEGLIPLLEALDVKGIVDPATFAAQAAENPDSMLSNIIEPLLDRVDELLSDPANELLDLLPELIYFVNAGGLDTTVKNTLRSIYNVLDAIKPIINVDLYEMIHFRLDYDSTNHDVVNQLLDDYLYNIELANQRFDLTGIGLGDLIAELTVGEVHSYQSLNGKTLYKMTYSKSDPENVSNKAAGMTIILRIAVMLVVKNADALKAILKTNLSEETYPYVEKLIDSLVKYASQNPGGYEDPDNIDLMLGELYYIFYAANVGSKATNQFLSDLNSSWGFVFKCFQTSESPEFRELGENLYRFFEDVTGGVIDGDGLASKGLIPFFQRIIAWIKALIETIQNLFKH